VFRPDSLTDLILLIRDSGFIGIVGSYDGISLLTKDMKHYTKKNAIDDGKMKLAELIDRIEDLVRALPTIPSFTLVVDKDSKIAMPEEPDPQ
jgi:hypothetical protein